MSTQYKLACPKCSVVHAVGPAQAGETISCACGCPVPVPTLRQLLRSEPVAERTEASGGDWDVRRGLIFVTGALLIAMAGLATWRILPQRQALNTRRPDFREIDFDVQQLTPVEAWNAWIYFRGRTLEYRATPEYLENRTQYREFSMYLYAAWAAAGLGLLLIVAALVWPSPRRSGHAT